jgi:hypothetical protein
MSNSPTTPIAAWKLPLIVAAPAVGIVAGFYLGGAGLGLAIGGLAAGSIVVMAIRKPPIYPIEPPAPTEFRRHILVVLAGPIDEHAIADHLESDSAVPRPAIRLAAPAQHGRLARWTSDLESGRERARLALVLGVASLAKAGYAADARVSDEGLVQSVEDELRTFPATEVLVVADGKGDVGKAVAELELRLTVPLRLAAKASGGGAAKPGRDGITREGDRAHALIELG